MNTLHMYNWQSINHLNQYLTMVNDNDCLVIYGNLNEEDIANLHSQFKKTNFPWHLVLANQSPHICQHVIDHDQWFNLIINAQNTFSWK